jgi:hypothetical protein
MSAIRAIAGEGNHFSPGFSQEKFKGVLLKSRLIRNTRHYPLEIIDTSTLFLNYFFYEKIIN